MKNGGEARAILSGDPALRFKPPARFPDRLFLHAALESLSFYRWTGIVSGPRIVP
jgi:hypothetical protein